MSTVETGTERKSVVSRGHTIAYEVTGGSGDVVMLLHGFGGSAAVWADYVGRLAPDHRVIAVDALGHGASDKPADPAQYVTADRAADFAAVLDVEGVDRAHLWGYSMGGRNVYAVATHHRDRVIDAVIGGAAPDPAGREQAWMKRRAHAFLDEDKETAWRLLGGAPERFQRSFESGNDMKVLGAVSMGLVEWACAPCDLAGLPTLHYAGTNDPFHERIKVAATESGGTLLELDGSDHRTATLRIDEVLTAVKELWAR